MSITNLREFRTHRLESAASRMIETLAAMQVPDELQAMWDSRVDAAGKRRVLEAEANKPGDGLPALWRELVAVGTGPDRDVHG